jgi:hypothetical protein
MRHAALTSTYTNGFDKAIMLSTQSLSKAHRGRVKRIARGVLLAFGIALCFPTDAGSTKPKDYIDYKTYSLYLLDFNYKQYKCLVSLYGKESAFNPLAVNGSHYGIPQGKSKYLKTLNGYEQIQWGLDYIGHRYGEPCVAWDHFKRKGWH